MQIFAGKYLHKEYNVLQQQKPYLPVYTLLR